MSSGLTESSGPAGRTRRVLVQQSEEGSPGAGPVKTSRVPSGDVYASSRPTHTSNCPSASEGS